MVFNIPLSNYITNTQTDRQTDAHTHTHTHVWKSHHHHQYHHHDYCYHHHLYSDQSGKYNFVDTFVHIVRLNGPSSLQR